MTTEGTPDGPEHARTRDHAVVPPLATLRLLQRMSLRGRLVLDRLDGAPVTEADVVAVRRAIDEINDLEIRADRAVGGSGSGGG